MFHFDAPRPARGSSCIEARTPEPANWQCRSHRRMYDRIGADRSRHAASINARSANRPCTTKQTAAALRSRRNYATARRACGRR